MNKFIWEKQNSLTSQFCKHVIYKFERDLRKSKGRTLGGFDDSVKKSDDISISRVTGWEEEDKVFYESLNKGLSEYKEYLSSNLHSYMECYLEDTGYQIQRTIGGKGYYGWHHDFCKDENGDRKITFIWYLNTVDGPGGETEFIDGTKVKPEEGKLIFFPATWDFVHQGIMPPEGCVKYLCTGWLYSRESY
jgi:hypothetical protein